MQNAPVSRRKGNRGVFCVFKVCVLPLFGHFALALIDAVGGDDAADAGEGIDITVPAYHCAGVQDAAAADFYAVAHHGTEFFQAGFHLLPAVLDNHQRFVALHIGRDGTGSHMRPVAKNGIAHIVIVGNLYPVKEDHVFQLRGVSHHGSCPHQGVPPDESAVADLCSGADDARAGDAGCGRNLRVLRNPDFLRRMVIDCRIQRRPQCPEEAANLRQGFPG